MNAVFRFTLVPMLALQAGITWASDACSTRAIVTSADVTVSDGSTFRTRSYFHSRDAAAIQHIRDREQFVVVEGPFGWVSAGEESRLGTEFHKLFALGHQYHAFLLLFDDIVANLRETPRLDFQGVTHRARSGDYPYGGTVHLIEGAEGEQPAGLLFEFPESEAIRATFSDWQELGGVRLPFRIDVDDGDRTFEYRYSSVETVPRSPLWFFESVIAPAIDQVRVYRLHRQLLAAHCLGDAELLANLSAEQVISASNGDLRRMPNHAISERFTALFERLNYSAYHDIEMPVVEIANSADLGWIGANVRAIGSDKTTGALFDSQWAWLMTVRKVDGVWLHTGNASTVVR